MLNLGLNQMDYLERKLLLNFFKISCSDVELFIICKRSYVGSTSYCKNSWNFYVVAEINKNIALKLLKRFENRC